MNKTQKAVSARIWHDVQSWARSVPDWGSFLLISAVGVLVYSNTLGNSFHFDDESSITANAAIKDLSNLKAIWDFSPPRFVTYLTFALNFRFGGLSVLGYHILNILIHIAAALAVWQLTLRIFRAPALEGDKVSKRAPLLALGAALVFVAHPIQTQAVTYIAQRAASLSTLFYTLSLMFFLEARLAQIAGRNRRYVALMFSLAATAGLVAPFSKEIAFTLPAALFLVEFFFLRADHRVSWKFALAILTLFVLVVLLLLSKNLMSLVDSTAISRVHYLLTQPRVLLSYVGLLVVPIDQSLDHFFAVSTELLEIKTFFGILGVTSLVLVGVWLFSRKKVISFGIFWFLLTLLPESSVIPLKDLMFEHRLYLPMVGFSILSAYVLCLLFGQKDALRYVIAVGCYAALLGSLAFARNSVWTDDLTLWSDVIRKSPMNPRAYHNRGRAYADRNMLSEALNDYGIAISLDPRFGPPHNNRASIYIKKQMLNEAIAECNEALRIGDVMRYQTARTYFNRATAYLMKNKIDSAFADFIQTVACDPTHEAAHFNLGILYSRRGEAKKAFESYTQCILLNPRNSQAFNSRGLIFKEEGQIDSALTDFNRAILAEPRFPRPYLNRGILLSEKGDFLKAIEDFSQVLVLSPNNFDGYYHRGVAQISRHEFERGIKDLDSALRVNPSFGPAYINRARAHIGLSQFEIAASDLKRAKSLGAPVDKELEAVVRKGLGR